MPRDRDDRERDLKALADAFKVFTAASGQLENSYRDLETWTAELRGRLQELDRERREAAERYQKLASELSAVLEALPGGVLVLDSHGRITRANSGARRLLGNDLGQRPWSEVRDQVFLRQTRHADDLALEDGRRLSLAQQTLGPSGGRILLLTDVTEQRQLEDLLARNQRLAAMGEMAAALAHQIRTPLSSALLYVSNAKRSEIDNPHRQELLSKCTECLNDLEQLISDMLQFARGARYEEKPLDLAEIFSAVEVSSVPSPELSQSISFELPPEPISIAGNREALAGAVMNLVNNGLQAAGRDAHVRVSANTLPDAVEIHVSDNGPGVEPGDAKRIFDPFFTSRPDGTGLGLAVARSVARAHGGELSLERSDEQGCEFTLKVPRAVRARTASPVQEVAA